MSENREICSNGKIIVSSTLKILHYVENINVYVEINNFKLSRFDNDTGQQIRKIGIKGTSEKKAFIFLPIQKNILTKKTVRFFK